MPDIIFVCVGGGGLIAGIAVLIKQLYPEVKIIGVEHKDAPTHAEARKAGKPVDLPYVGAFADGAAVKRAGKETFAIASKYVDEFILVDTDSICAAIKAVFEDTRTILEPAGALSVAGIEAYVSREHCKNLTFAAITSGANINFARLRHVAERAELGAEREAVFAIKIPERPGSFKEFCEMLGKHSITEFNYRYFDPSEAQIFVGISIDGLKQKEALAKVFKKKKFEAIDLSHNEIAKNHVRYMVGGRNPLIADEKIFSFRFPERPGALMRFLVSLPKKWNISLFHYRNHGSDIGRVLAGIQIPSEDAETYQEQLRSIGYSFREQTENPVCQLFL
jgi:threonine dehydratase